MNRNRLLSSQHDDVLRMSEVGLSISRISDALNVSTNAVSKVVKQKYPNHQERKILPVKAIVTEYKSGATLDSLAIKYHTTSKTIKSRLQDAGVEIRGIGEIQRVHHFNGAYFEKIDSAEKAYWLGFIFADGCVLSNREDTQISLARKDRSHLEKFLSSIEYSGPGGINDLVGVGFGHMEILYSRVNLRSSQMHGDLIAKGCIPGKSLDVGPPIDLPSDYVIDFIRGVVDGGGYISAAGLASIEIVGAYRLLSWISEKLGLSEPRPHKSIWRIRASGNKAKEIIL